MAATSRLTRRGSDATSSSPEELVEAGRSVVPMTDRTLRLGLPHETRAHTPWLDLEGTVVWSRWRIAVCKVIHHHSFDCVMAAIIIFNVYIIVLETDQEAACYPQYKDDVGQCPTANGNFVPWVLPANMVLMVIYTLEAILRLYVDRRAYLHNPWNILDCFIVVTGWIAILAGSVMRLSFLRFFRLARLARLLRLLVAVKELYLLLAGLMTALRTIAWGAVMMFGMLLLWAIIIVELVHPHNTEMEYSGCDRCSQSLSSVLRAMLTLFQTIVAGDNWGMIAVPVIESHPWAGILFIAALLTISLGLTNLILAVIVERASEARDLDFVERVKEKKELESEQMQTLLRLCMRMDTNGDGLLSHKELLAAYEDVHEFRTLMQVMDIGREEVQTIFRILDADDSGELSYREFCEQLHMVRTRDPRTTMNFMRLCVKDVRQAVEHLTRDVVEPMALKVQENSMELRSHSKMLASIERSSTTEFHTTSRPAFHSNESHSLSDHLDSTSNCGIPASDAAKIAQGHVADAPRHVVVVRTPSFPTSPPQPPTEAYDTTWPSAESLLEEIRSLGGRAHELGSMRDGIARRLDETMTTLARHRDILDKLEHELGADARSKDPAVEDLDHAEVMRIGDKLARLQQNLHERLVCFLRDVDNRLRDGEETLAMNTQLLASLTSDLGSHERQLPSPLSGTAPPGDGTESGGIRVVNFKPPRG